jgi:hypothetical protein
MTPVRLLTWTGTFVSVEVPMPKTPEAFDPHAQGLPGTVLVLIEVIVTEGEVVVLVLAELEQPIRFKITATIMKITPIVVINFFITHLLQI